MSFYFTHLIRNIELQLVHGTTSLSCIVFLEMLGLFIHVEFKLEVENKTCLMFSLFIYLCLSSHL